MKTRSVFLLAGFGVVCTLAALAQDADHSWSKSYPVSGKPSLDFETSDAGITFHSCGECREIRIRVQMTGRTMHDYRLEEGQSGNEVHFRLKELPRMGWHMSWHPEQTQVTVETPAQLTLQAKTSDGNVALAGLQGDLSLNTGDGNVDIRKVAGSLRIRSGDGRVTVSDASGAIDAHTSDGNLEVDGLFETVALHTSDGQVNLNLREGSKLTGSSSIQSSDGSVTLRVPASFGANLDVHTSDGHVDCAFPVATDSYRSGGGEGNQLRGKLNGGGAPLSISTSDGNVRIDRL